MDHEETHWCYQCNQIFEHRGRDVICPSCHSGFVQELNEMQGVEPEEQVPPPPDYPPLFDTMYDLLGENVVDTRSRFIALVGLLAREEPALEPVTAASRNPNFDIRGVRSGGYVPDPCGREGITSRPFMAAQFPDSSFPNRRRRQNSVDLEYSIVQSEIEQLIDHAMNSYSGPPPVPQSAINALHTINITRTHIQSDCQCPVCKDEFVLGSEVKMMPCHHIYHSDCIIPWLVQHNSCPLCRYEIPAQGTTSENHDNNQSGVTTAAQGNGSVGRERRVQQIFDRRSVGGRERRVQQIFDRRSVVRRSGFS